MTTPSAPPDPYANYAEWKQWSGTFAPSDPEARYFAAEFAGIPLAGRRVLEIGFGNGACMAWARAQGADVGGLEINAAMLEAARRHGFDARQATLDELATAGERYDLIVAFDVLEHWSTAELFHNFDLLPRLLADGGCLLARFPNGHSPFGRIYQHGDFSHQSTLSTFKIEYLAAASHLEIVRVANACRVSGRNTWSANLRQRWMAWRRRRIERHLARLYGMRKLPLDPNLVAVLRKPHVSSPSNG